MKLKSPADENSLLADSLMGGINELTPEEVQTELAKLELEKLQEERGLVRNKQRIKIKQRESIAREENAKHEKTLADQRGCSHRKQNGSTALAAMYNHQNILMAVCQNCGKEWMNNDLPQDLAPDGRDIGGCGVR